MCSSVMWMSSIRRRSEVQDLEIRGGTDLHGVGVWRIEMVRHHRVESGRTHGRFLHETIVAIKKNCNCRLL